MKILGDFKQPLGLLLIIIGLILYFWAQPDSFYAYTLLLMMLVGIALLLFRLSLRTRYPFVWGFIVGVSYFILTFLSLVNCLDKVECGFYLIFMNLPSVNLAYLLLKFVDETLFSLLFSLAIADGIIMGVAWWIGFSVFKLFSKGSIRKR